MKNTHLQTNPHKYIHTTMAQSSQAQYCNCCTRIKITSNSSGWDAIRIDTDCREWTWEVEPCQWTIPAPQLKLIYWHKIKIIARRLDVWPLWLQYEWQVIDTFKPKRFTATLFVDEGSIEYDGVDVKALPFTNEAGELFECEDGKTFVR